MVWAVLHAAQGPPFLVTMLSKLALLEVACSLAAFGGLMRPWCCESDSNAARSLLRIMRKVRQSDLFRRHPVLPPQRLLSLGGVVPAPPLALCAGGRPLRLIFASRRSFWQVSITMYNRSV